MSDGLPKQIDVQRLVASGGLIEGAMPCRTDGRLADMIMGCESDISVSLQFGKRDDGFGGMSGQIQCHVSMQCQRCLEPVSVQLDCPVNLGVVSDESQEALLPDSVEPLFCGEEPVDLVELVEDELILALPLVPMHEHCEAPADMSDASGSADTAEKDNPFAVLKNLKRDQDLS